MQVAKLDDMIRGWFIGNFEPTLYKTNDVEVAVKYYVAGDQETWHFHKIATEITVVIIGKVRMNGKEYIAGDMIIIEPGEGADFEVLEDTITTVVKLPGANDDKYLKGD